MINKMIFIVVVSNLFIGCEFRPSSSESPNVVNHDSSDAVLHTPLFLSERQMSFLYSWVDDPNPTNPFVEK